MENINNNIKEKAIAVLDYLGKKHSKKGTVGKELLKQYADAHNLEIVKTFRYRKVSCSDAFYNVIGDATAYMRNNKEITTLIYDDEELTNYIIDEVVAAQRNNIHKIICESKLTDKIDKVNFFDCYNCEKGKEGTGFKGYTDYIIMNHSVNTYFMQNYLKRKGIVA